MTEDNTQLVLARLTPVAQAPSDCESDIHVCKTFSTAWFLGRRAQGGLVMPPVVTSPRPCCDRPVSELAGPSLDRTYVRVRKDSKEKKTAGAGKKEP